MTTIVSWLRPSTRRHSARLPALLLLGALALTATAPGAIAQERIYQVEMVLFEHIGGGAGTSGKLYFPRHGSAMNLTSNKAAAAGFFPVESGLALNESADKMRSSRAYRVLRHFAWQQPGLDRKNALPIRIAMGKAITMYLPDDLKPYDRMIPASLSPQPDRNQALTSYTVAGTLELYLGRFLHLNANLVFTDVERGESFRLSQSRKMRSRELHYIDNPRFGILTRIVPVENATADDPVVEEPVVAPVDAPVQEDAPEDAAIPATPQG